ELQENNYKALHELLDEAAGDKNAEAGSPTQKVGDFYRSGMDSAAIDKAGMAPLNDMMARIDNIKDANGVMNEVALEQTQGLHALFGFTIAPDDKNVTQQIAQFYQGGLGMPDRDYYFKTDDRSTKIREAYKKYIVDMLQLM